MSADDQSEPSLRDRAAQVFLGDPWSLAWVLLCLTLATLIGLRFYLETMDAVPTPLWPLYADSPTATVLGALSIVTLFPFVAGSKRRPVYAVPVNRPLAYLHTIAFVWLVTFGIWPAIALGIAAETYLAQPNGPLLFFGNVVLHLLFVVLALLIPAYGATTRGALATALGLGLFNVVVDYGFGYHPPLRYDPGPFLIAATLLLVVGAVAFAAHQFDRLENAI